MLDRVRKLLALATSSNAHEAAAAAARAQEIIDKYRLEQWLVTNEPEADPIIDARDQPLEVSRRVRRWKSALASVLACANGCVAYRSDRGRDQAIILVGRRQDRDAVAEIYGGMVKQIEWLSATHAAGQSKKWHESFRLGAVDAVAKRLSKPTESGSGSDSTALVAVHPALVAHTAALDAFVAENLRFKKGRGISVIGQAWRDGKARSEELS
ncbi:MAG: DUF2786 domain-containing protein [Myxococcota bacterium]